jgi:hypothetical protein
MLAKIISAGALTLLLTGGALADQPHKIYAGHSNSTSSCKAAFSLPKWQRANAKCPALDARAPGSTGSAVHSQRGASSQHNIYADHRNSPARRAANPAPYGYRWVQ